MILVAGGVVLLIALALVFSRALSRFSSLGDREDLHVSRGWLAEHQARQSGD